MKILTDYEMFENCSKCNVELSTRNTKVNGVCNECLENMNRTQKAELLLKLLHDVGSDRLTPYYKSLLNQSSTELTSAFSSIGINKLLENMNPYCQFFNERILNIDDKVIIASIQENCSKCGRFNKDKIHNGLDICLSCVNKMHKKELVIYLVEQLESLPDYIKPSMFQNITEDKVHLYNDLILKDELKKIVETIHINGAMLQETAEKYREFYNSIDWAEDKHRQCQNCNKTGVESSFSELHQLKASTICDDCFHRMNDVDLARYFLFELSTIPANEMSGHFRTLNKGTIENAVSLYNKEQLQDMLYEIMYDQSFLLEEYTIDYHQILNYYTEENKDVFSKQRNIEEVETDYWKQDVPLYFKQHYPRWNSYSLKEAYSKTKELMKRNGASARENLMSFASDLSEIIFEVEEDESDELVDTSSEIEQLVMYKVEMIILPHLEVLDRIKEAQGNILFTDVNLQHFSDDLKEEAKNRDGWKCQICTDTIGLHVHHKIPRRLGGVNHIDNLVTLCASCHGAVETADISNAFKKGVANYHRAIGRKIQRDEITHDKETLKMEVESTLEKLLSRAVSKSDNETSAQVVEVMDKLKIIFYE